MRIFAFLISEALKAQLGLFEGGNFPTLPKGHRPTSAKPAAAPTAQLGLFDFAAAQKPSDPTHGGTLHPETRTDVSGRTQTRWIAQEDVPEAKPAPRAEPAPPPGPPLALDSAPPAKTPKKTKAPGSRLEHKIEAGEHTWGSRKDLARPTTSGDLALFSDAEAYQFVTKAALFAPMDPEQARADGKSPGYVVLRVALEKAIASRPEDNAKDRAAYMDGLDFMAKSMDGCRTAAELQEFLADWRQLSSGRRRVGDDYATREEAQAARSQAMGKPAPRHDTGVQEVGGRFRAYIDADDLGNEPRIRLPNGRKSGGNSYHRMAAALGPNLYAVVDDDNADGSYFSFRRGRDGWKTHREALKLARTIDKGDWDDPTVQAAVESATGKKTVAKKQGAEGDEAVSWGAFAEKRAAGATARRVGGRQFDHTSSAKMVETFGLKNVQFGQWISDDDAREHVKSATAALSDLADVVGVDPKTVSLNGRLTLGLGARGKGGAARAHYEGWTKAINLTKWAGGGSLAHEWGHALDNVMAEMGAQGGAEKYVSDSHAVGQRLGHMNPEVRAAFGGVMDAIYGPKKTRDRAYQEKVIATNAIARIYGRSSPTYAKAHAAFLAWQTESGYHLKHSNYFHDSDAFNGKSARGKDPENATQGYWTRPHELFARAFEAYVEDSLEKSGRASTYLVNGTRGGGKMGGLVTGRFRDDAAKARGEHAWPYPMGEDRTRINAAFERLFMVLRSTGEIHKAIEAAFPAHRGVLAFLFGSEAAKAKAKGDNLTMDLFGGMSGGDATHGGKLHPEKRTDKLGRTSTRYVAGTAAPGGGALEPGGHTEPRPAPASPPQAAQAGGEPQAAAHVPGSPVEQHERHAQVHTAAAEGLPAGDPVGDKHREAALAHTKAARMHARSGQSQTAALAASRLSDEANARSLDVQAVKDRMTARDATRTEADPALAAAQRSQADREAALTARGTGGAQPTATPTAPGLHPNTAPAATTPPAEYGKRSTAHGVEASDHSAAADELPHHDQAGKKAHWAAADAHREAARAWGAAKRAPSQESESAAHYATDRARAATAATESGNEARRAKLKIHDDALAAQAKHWDARIDHEDKAKAARAAGHKEAAEYHEAAAAAHDDAGTQHGLLARKGDVDDYKQRAQKASAAAEQRSQEAISKSASAATKPEPEPEPTKWRTVDRGNPNEGEMTPFRVHAAKEREHKFAAAKHKADADGAQNWPDQQAHRAAATAHKDAEAAHAQARHAALSNPSAKGNQQLFDTAHAASAKASAASEKAKATTAPPEASQAAPAAPQKAPSRVEQAAAAIHAMLPPEGEQPQQLTDIARRMRGHDFRHIEKAAQLLHKQGKAHYSGSMIQRKGDGGQASGDADAQAFRQRQEAHNRLLQS